MPRRCHCGAEFRPQSKYDHRVLCGACLAKARQRWKLAQGQQDSRDNSDNGCYVPTEEEIRACCLEFQSRWSDWERAKRAGKLSEFTAGVETEVVPVRALTGG